MLSTAIVIFREILEIALVLSVVMAATCDLAGRNKWVVIGVAGGVLGSVMVALFAEAISGAAEGLGQELFNAMILLSASVVIGATALWMSKHAREMTAHLRHVSNQVVDGHIPLYSIAVVIALAVLREGAEIVLFVYGMIASGQGGVEIASGSAIGFVGGAAFGIALYYGMISISPKYIFAVTTWLLIFLCAGMASTAAQFLSSAGWFETMSEQVWDTSAIISDGGIVGQTLHALLGYTAKPMQIQVVFYLIVIGVLIVSKWFLAKKSVNLKSAAAVAVCALAAFANPSDSNAAKQVHSPYVEKGELEVEWKASHDYDDDAEKDGKEGQEFSVGYGFAERWYSELSGEIEKEAGDNRDYKMTAVEWENRFQLTEKGQYFVDLGGMLAYRQSFEDDHANNIEAKLLLAKDIGKTSHALNLTLEEEVGQHAEGGLASGLAWSSKYRLSEYFEPGFEYHAEFGRFNQNLNFDEQEHLAGPVVYGKLPYGFGYDVGYLFGISDAAPDGVLKSIIEYEVHF